MKLYQYSFSSMGCPCSIQIYSSSESHFIDIRDAVYQEVDRLDKHYTNYSGDSFTAEINNSSGNRNGIIVDAETATLLDYSQACYQQSGGFFDITAGILRQAWDSHDPNPKLPSKSLLKDLLAKVGWKRLIWKNPKLTLPIDGMNLDFGGVVKEYAADAAASICKINGISSGFIDLGGDITVIGPHPDGRPWAVGIKAPRGDNNESAAVFIHQGGLASSGDFERYIEIDGCRYSHILNPKTGWPVSGVSATSVVADHCLIAGSFSTIAMLKGPKRGPQFLKKSGLPHMCADDRGRILSTKGFVVSKAA